jgi:hypothetical protein
MIPPPMVNKLVEGDITCGKDLRGFGPAVHNLRFL